MSWVALGVTLVLPSLLFKLAAQKEKGREVEYRAVAGKSAQHGGQGETMGSHIWGAQDGAHRIHFGDGFFIDWDEDHRARND